MPITAKLFSVIQTITLANQAKGIVTRRLITKYFKFFMFIDVESLLTNNPTSLSWTFYRAFYVLFIISVMVHSVILIMFVDDEDMQNKLGVHS